MSQIGKKEIFTIALGSVIGWGAFVLPGNVFLPNYGVINTLVGFVIAIVMLVFIEKSYAVVMRHVPKSGGEYSFARDILGKKSGFVTGWGLLLAYISIIPLNATAVPMVLDAVLPAYNQGRLLYTVADYPVYINDILVSLSIIVLFAIINLLGIKGALRAQNVLVFALVFALLAIGGLTAVNLESPQWTNLASNWGELDAQAVIRIIAFAPWAFIGFDAVAQLAGDHRMPAKQVSRMTLFAIVIGAVVYNALNIITAFGMAGSELANAAWATGEAVRYLVGDVLFYLLAIGMFGAVVSGLNGFFISSSRLVTSMSSDYRIGSRLAMLKPAKDPLTHKTVRIPKWVMYFITLCAMVVPFFGRTALLWFVDLASIGASVAYLMTCLCAYKLANTSGSKAVSIIGMLVSVAFLVFLLTPIFDANIGVPSYFSLLFWIVFGLVVYVVANKRLTAMS